jgi:sulfur carrier protein
MRIEINGERREVAAETLAALLQELEYDERHVATALNQAFVRKVDRAETKLREGDRIEIVSPRQGG